MMNSTPARPMYTAEVSPDFCNALGITPYEALINGTWYYAYRLPNAVLVPFGTFIEVWRHADISEWRLMHR